MHYFSKKIAVDIQASVSHEILNNYHQICLKFYYFLWTKIYFFSTIQIQNNAL